MYKKHLEGGVKKGALTAEQADAKFAEWVDAKGNKIEGKKDNLTKSKDEVRKAALAAEAKKNADRAAALAIKNAPVVEVVEEEVVETPEVEDAPVEDAPVAEATEEAPAADATETTEEEKA